MSLNTPKFVAVVGGTGNLGSSVALSLHDNDDFKVRVLSRDPSAPKAVRMSRLGVEVIRADFWSPQDLARAFQGCWGLFINIDSDAPNFKQQIGPTEADLGRLILDAAVEAGVQHVVHASLPAATKLTGGKVPVVAFDDKAAVSEYALQPGKFATATIVSAGWFFENAFDPKYTASFGGFATIQDSEGYLTWKTPPMGNSPELVPFLAVADDYGDFVHGVFLDPQSWDKKYIHGVSESLSFTDMTAAFQRVTGKPARYTKVETNGSLSAPDKFKQKEVNGLFDLMQAIQGRFFNGDVTDPEPAKALKASAMTARGRADAEKHPMSAESFFRKYC